MRILDVNLNRLTESLKLTEDIARFSLENKEILKDIRKIRKIFLRVKKQLPVSAIISSRQSRKDPGRHPEFDLQKKRSDKEILYATITRAKESARTIEEILKLEKLAPANLMKEIRFSLYDIEKHIIKLFHKEFNPRIYAILDETYISFRNLKRTIKTLINNGTTMIQLRICSLPDRTFFKYARFIRKNIDKKKVKFIINNRVDIAHASGADGVHLGQDDLPLSKARTIIGDTAIIGVSTHNLKEAINAQKAGADYIGVGAIFKTQTKPSARHTGLNTLREICKKVNIPVVAIGGINAQNYGRILRAGASGAALCSYLFKGNLRNNLHTLTLIRK